jgi:4-methyl-5(b-hydroxyethyl)-thiazole monophosphate biosynthesis
MVYVFLADGFETIEALAVVDVLRRAGIELQIVGVTGMAVTSAHGVKVEADIAIDAWDAGVPAGMLILPGGLEGVQHMAKCAVLMNAVKAALEADRPVAAICAAPAALAQMGWLQGRRATCYPTLEGQLTAAGAVFIRDESVVVDRSLITGSSAGASIDFALRIAAFLKDSETAEKVRAALCHGAPRNLT